MRYKHVAVVSPQGQFPIDMLRYDGCHPQHETDSNAITDNIRRETATNPIIRVVRYDNEKRDPWTIRRWQSFNCTVLETSTEKVL